LEEELKAVSEGEAAVWLGVLGSCVKIFIFFFCNCWFWGGINYKWVEVGKEKPVLSLQLQESAL
jgi:hypothetical protein